MSSDLSPEIKAEIVKRQEGYGTFDFPLGMDIFAVRRLAAKFAVVENLEMRFRFNEKDYTVTPETARELLTPKNIRTHISGGESAIANYQRMIEKCKGEVEEERRLGEILYGPDFTDSANTDEK